MANNNAAQGEKPKKRGRVKDTFAELKKVTWPTFGKTMKQTGAVLVVTLFFFVILLVMDYLLGLAHGKLIEELNKMPDAASAVSQIAAGFKNTANALFSGAPTVPLII